MSVNLTLVPFLDEISCEMRKMGQSCEGEFLEFARNCEKWRLEWLHSEEQSQRLQLLLDEYKHKLKDSEKKLCVARRLLEEEQLKRKVVEHEMVQLEKQLELVRDAVFQGKSKLNDETKEKLAFLNNTSVRSRRSLGRSEAQRLNTINEALDSTGSLLSELGVSQSEDELDTSLLCRSRPWKKLRTPQKEEAPSVKRARLSANKSFETGEVRVTTTDHLVATTTVTVEHGGPITAYSKIDTGSVPSSDNQEKTADTPHSNINVGPNVRVGSNQYIGTLSQRSSPVISPIINSCNKFNNRPHAFVNRTMLTPDICGVCDTKIKFAKVVMRCKECRFTCHIECKNDAPLPCIPGGNTPNKKGFVGTIADYAPQVPPMVPAIVVHCIQEVERRGLNEVGIYRIPGSDRDIKAFKEKYLRGKGVPCMAGLDIHVVCGTLKDFLRSLKEPLVTRLMWVDFVRSAEMADQNDSRAAMYYAISNLPQPNRDTLAYLILHLQRVAEWPDCKMPTENLAKVFGPTIVGYSSNDIDGAALVRETKKQVAVMQLLMSLPSEYWEKFTNGNFDYQPQGSDLRHTPSTRSLAATQSCSSVSRGYFTPAGGTM